jgi:hypothetical protein
VTPLAFAQDTPKTIDFNQHLWVSYSGDHPVSGKWGVHFDAQWRRSDLGVIWQQYQLRPAVNYEFSKAVLFTAGYAWTKSYPYGDFPGRTGFPEHRIYQQLLVTHSLGSLRLQHRSRLEQRFIKYPDPQPRTWTYQNRFRYLIKAEVPLTKDADGNVEWYIPAFDEILIGIPPNYGARPFDQNRVFLGIGKAVSGAKVEVGYMNQFLGQRNGRIFEFNNTIFMTVTSSVPLSRLWGGD